MLVSNAANSILAVVPLFSADISRFRRVWRIRFVSWAYLTRGRKWEKMGLHTISWNHRDFTRVSQGITGKESYTVLELRAES